MSLFANCRSQFLLDRLERWLKLFVSTASGSTHEYASQFDLAIILYAKNTKKNVRKYRVAGATVQLNEPATSVNAVMVERHRPDGAETTAIIAATDWTKTVKSNN